MTTTRWDALAIITMSACVSAAMVCDACRDPNSPQTDADAHYDFVEAAAPPLNKTDTSSCGRMCANLDAHGCSEANPKQGDGCIARCNFLVDSGVSSLDPECIANAATVEEIRKCPLIKCVGM